MLAVACIAGPAVAAAAPDTMAERVKPCVACHSAEGRKLKDEYYPRLNGKPAGYLFNQLTHFREHRRQYRAMNLLLETLPDAYLAGIAEYFAAQPPRYDAPVPAATPEPAIVRGNDSARDLPACASCHGRDLAGTLPAVPGLIGLPRDYISAQFGAWRVGTRHAAAPDCMGAIAKKLTQAEINDLATWLAAQPVPAGAKPVAASSTELRSACGSIAAAEKGIKP